MQQSYLTQVVLDQSKDLFWIVDLDFKLVYANKKYLDLMKEMTGTEKKLMETVFVEGFGEGVVDKWRMYFERAFLGEGFEVEEHFYDPRSNDIQFTQVTLVPLKDEQSNIFAVSCQSKDITRIVKYKSESNQLLDASLDVFCTINEKGHFVFVNAASLDHWGYSPQELNGTAFTDLVLEDDLLKTNEILATILSSQPITSFQNRYKKKNGGIAYNLWSIRWDENTKLRYAVARDCTEKLEQESVVLQSELRFKSLVQEGSDLVAIIDVRGTFKYVSPNSTFILGLTPESLIGRNGFDFIHQADRDIAATSLQKIGIEKRIVLEPLRFRDHNGSWRWMDTILTNMITNPAVKGIVVNARDITAKIEEKQKLKLLESVITHTKDAILITEAEPFDEPGPRILFVNEAFTKMTGYSAAEVIGKTPRILQGPNSDKVALARLSKSIRNWESCEITTINYKKNGEEFWINFSLSPVANEKGWYTHWISIERDVTEQKNRELEKELSVEISRHFNENTDYLSATTGLCQSICKFGNFDWAEVWIANLEKTKIQLFAHYVPNPQDEKFYQYNDEVNSLKIGEGLGGKVWAAGKQLHWNDIENYKDFVRKDAAKKIGLQAVLGIPLIYNNEVIAVLKVGTKQSNNYLTKFTPTFTQLEKFIGSEIHRKKLENDLSHLFNAIPDIICLLDLKGKFLKVNQSGCNLMGYAENAILFHKFEDFVHPHDKGIFTNRLIQVKDEGTILEFENRYVTNKNKVVYLSWFCNFDLKEGIIYATAKNITEEKKLRELNRQASHLARIGSWELDLINESLFWSDEVHHLHGTDPKVFVPKMETGINFYRSDFQELVESNIQNCITTGEAFDFEAVLITVNNKELWVRSIGNAEFTDGVCKRIYGSFQDIHDRKESENRLISLSNNLPGVIYQYTIYPDGTDAISHLSGGVEELWGYTAEEVLNDISLVWESAKLGGDFDEIQASIAQSIRDKTNWSCRFRCVMPNGKLKTHFGSGTPSFLADGSIIFSSIMLDITQQAKNEELLAEASKISRIGSWELDLINEENDTMYWSPMVKEIIQVEVSYFPTFTGLLSFFVGESKESMKQAKHLLIAEGVEFDLELLLMTAKGQERWIRCIGKSEMANSKRTKIYGSFQDIHERKKAAEAISESEEKRRLIMSGALDAIICIDIKEAITFWNPQAEIIFGWKESEVIGQVLSELIVPILLRKFHTKGMKHYQETGEGKALNVLLELTAIRRGGEEFPIELTIIPINQGGEVFFCAFIRDITQRKKAEQSILQSNDRFNKVTEATNDAIWDLDLVKKTYYCSKAIERFFAKGASGLFHADEMWTKDYFHPDDIDKMKLSFYEAVNNPDITKWEYEYRVINKKKELLHVVDRAIIYRNRKGNAVRMVGAMTDISEQKQFTVQLSTLNQSLEKYTVELERSNEELEQFAFVASHDLQEPLRMISSFMELLQRKYGNQLDEKAHEYIHFATDGAKRMKQIILDLLEYSRSSKLEEIWERVNCNEILSDFKQLRRKIITEKNATLQYEQVPTIYSNKIVVTQILHCLVDNALKYSRNEIPSLIDVQVVENEKEWLFSIRDNGIGIDEQFYDKIFILFQRLHNKDKYSGTGIGLSVAKRNVEFLGGKIWVTSIVGEGSIFYFTIAKRKKNG